MLPSSVRESNEAVDHSDKLTGLWRVTLDGSGPLALSSVKPDRLLCNPPWMRRGLRENSLWVFLRDVFTEFGAQPSSLHFVLCT